MKVLIAPASTKTGAATIQALLSLGQPSVKVTALYRDPRKAPVAFVNHSNFHAVTGSVSDASSLGFSGADAVLAITPPVFDGQDNAVHADLVSRNVKQAVEEAGTVERLVLLSSLGAEYDHGVGEIKTNHIAETIFATTKIKEIIFVRCAYFMENWTISLDTFKSPEPFFFSTITPLTWNVPMVAIADIGHHLAAQLTKPIQPSSTPRIYELHGPREYTPLDAQKAFSAALGCDVGIRPVEKAELHAFYGRIFPPAVVNDWVEMATSFLPGGVMVEEPVSKEGIEVLRGETTLEEALRAATAGIRTGREHKSDNKA